MALLTTATTTATATIMIYSFITLACFYFILFSKCNGTAITASEKKEIDDAFDSFFTLGNVEDLFKAKSHLRVAIMERALLHYYKDNKSDFVKSSRAFGIYQLIDGNCDNSINTYFKPEYKVDFNINRWIITSPFEPSPNLMSTTHLVDGKRRTFCQYHSTPLQIAVAQNRFSIVKNMVAASLNPKLKLDMPNSESNEINARNIARKIFNLADRIKMLSVLIIDMNKHDMTKINANLKYEHSMTVKEAVLANNVEMVESAFLLGNFGDKNDIHTIRWAMMNENIEILEILVLEGYAIPPVGQRPICIESFTGGKNNYKYARGVKFLMANGTDRRPLPAPLGRLF